MARDEKKVEITETDVVRWICYTGFFVCTICLVFTLSFGSRWLGFLVGAVGFGIFTLKMYTLHVEGERQRASTTEYREQHPPERSGTTANSEWDIQGDPVTPPRRPQ